MAAATTVIPVRTIVIGIASDITVMRTDILAGDTPKGEAIALGTVARRTGQFKTDAASRIVATEIYLEIEAAEVGGLFNLPFSFVLT
jgi:hypothetical protein